MLHTLNVGDKVKVWPRPGLSLPASPPTVLETPSGVQVLPGRALSEAGEEVVWSAWLHEHAKGGALFFSDPRVTYVEATHCHPDDLGKQMRAEKKGKE